MKRTLLLAISLSIVSAAALADETEPNEICVTPAQWVKTDNRKEINATDVLKELTSRRVVLLGEDHDNAEHHRWQMHTLVQLHTLQPKLAIGFESFPRSTQPVLDDWIAGKLNESEFLKAVEWEKIWSYDPNYYLPMFHYARMHKIPLLALNVKRSLVSKVSEQGWDNVPDSDKEGVSKPAPASDNYLEILKQVFQSHRSPHGNGKSEEPTTIDEAMLSRFVQGQLVWDRAMAEAIEAGLKRENVQLVVAVMGAGHILRGAGVPYQLEQSGVKENVSLLAWDGVIPCDQLDSGIADYVFGVSRDNEKIEEDRPKLGVLLENDKKGVKVVKVYPNTVASELRIQSGDYVLEAGSRKIKEVGDVIKSVQNTNWGNWLPLKIKRGKKELNIVAKFPAKD